MARKKSRPPLDAPDCPECGLKLGLGLGRSIYKHAIMCFGLEDRGIVNLTNDASAADTIRNGRIKTLLAWAAERGEQK